MAYHAVSFPRRLDPHQALKVQPLTLKRYRSAALTFVQWCDEHGYRPAAHTDWDDLLVEFKNDAALRKAAFELLVASVEFFFPRYKGQLSLAHSVLSGWGVAHQVHPHVPLCRGPAALVGLHFAALGHARLLGGVMMQVRLGLRPGELLGVLPPDVVLPEEQPSLNGGTTATIGLGLRCGTKAKRPQSVTLRLPDDHDIINFLRLEKSLTPKHMPLVPYSIDRYRRLLKSAEARIGFFPGWSPHSARAGFASEARASGVPFTELREAGRWVADSSLRVYLDEVAAAGIAGQLHRAGLTPAISWAAAFWPRYCTRDTLTVEAIRRGPSKPNAASGVSEGSRWQVGEFQSTNGGGIVAEPETSSWPW